MMDDMLLTPEEWNAAAERGITKWTDQLDPNNPTSFSSSAPFVYEEVCRAQVRKVVEWMGAKCECSRQGWHSPHYCVHCTETLPIALTESDWQALREAAGEGER